MFDDKSFTGWQKSGKDIHSLIADPLFVNPGIYDFHFKKLTIARKIKFIPFDYSKAGVYGSDEWKKLAEYDIVLSRKFDDLVSIMETKISK